MNVRPAGGLLRRAGRPKARGQALIEFALVLPILLMLVFGICDFGIHMFRQMQAGNCARDIARRAAVWSTSLPTGGVCEGYNLAFEANGTSVSLPLAGKISSGGSLTVIADWDGDAWIILDTFLPVGTIVDTGITARVTMRMEGTRAS